MDEKLEEVSMNIEILGDKVIVFTIKEKKCKSSMVMVKQVKE